MSLGITGGGGVIGKELINTINLKLPTSDGTLVNVKEKINIIAGAVNATPNVDVDTALIWYFTSVATNDWTTNFRSSSTKTLNSSMSIGEVISGTIMNTQGATAYKPTTFSIDSNIITAKWLGGSVPTAGDINSINNFGFSIIKTANATFTLINSMVKFA
jgi:hypothetical protein